MSNVNYKQSGNYRNGARVIQATLPSSQLGSKAQKARVLVMMEPTESIIAQAWELAAMKTTDASAKGMLVDGEVLKLILLQVGDELYAYEGLQNSFETLFTSRERTMMVALMRRMIEPEQTELESFLSSVTFSSDMD